MYKILKRSIKVPTCDLLSLCTHRFSCPCVSCWWWNLTCCPGSAGRWPMAFMSCWRLMQPTSTAQMTGTHSSPCWSASGPEWNLLPLSSLPPPLLKMTQVQYFSQHHDLTRVAIACDVTLISTFSFQTPLHVVCKTLLICILLSSEFKANGL